MRTPDGLSPVVSHERLDLDSPGVSLRGVLPAARYLVAGELRTYTPTLLAGDGSGALGAAPVPGTPDAGLADEVALRLEFEPVAQGVVLTAVLTNRLPQPIDVVSLSPLTLGPARLAVGHGPAAWSLFRNGWGSWSLVRSFRMDEVDPDPWFFPIKMTAVDPATPRTRVRGEFRSELVAALADTTTGDALVLGFLGSARAFGVIDLTVRQGMMIGLEATSQFDGIALAPGAELRSEPLLVAAGDDGVGLLERWADDLGAAMSARIPARPPSGWCSWYYYFTKVTERDMLENLRAVDRLGARLSLDYVMVDDGHQSAIGDWLVTNDKFPSGMGALATAIKATGRDAGIWLAPFIVDPESRVARANPDWILRGDDGRPVRALYNPPWNQRRFMHALDTSRPDVQEWLAETARVIRHEWGYRILKLDFLYAAALPGPRADAGSTRAAALRAGLDAIRAGAGDDSFLLGCGLPLGPAVGVVDGMRIGPDVTPLWSNRLMRWATTDTAGVTTRGAVRSALTRSFLHNRLWANDPDCVMVRTDRTRLSEAEVRTLAAVAGITDGMLVSSDRLEVVPPERIDILAFAQRLAGGRARVPDLFERGLPEHIVSQKDDETLVGVFNLEERARSMVADLSGLGLDDAEGVELVQDRPVRAVGSRLELGTIAAHDCRIVSFVRFPHGR